MLNRKINYSTKKIIRSYVWGWFDFSRILANSTPMNLSASESWRRSTDAASLTGVTTDNTLMDGCFDAVEHFEVQFRELVFLVCGGFLDITKRGGIDDVADNESLDGLILGDSLSGGNASNTLDVSASVLVSSVVTSLDSHDEKIVQLLRVAKKR